MMRPKKSLPLKNKNLTRQLKYEKSTSLKSKIKQHMGKYEYKHFLKEIKRKIRKAEWNNVNNVFKDNLEQNNTKQTTFQLL